MSEKAMQTTENKNTIGTLAKIFGIISISFQGLIVLLMFFGSTPTIVTTVNFLLGLDGLLIMFLLAPAGIVLSIIGLVKKQKGAGLGLGLCIACLFLPTILFAVYNFVSVNVMSAEETWQQTPSFYSE